MTEDADNATPGPTTIAIRTPEQIDALREAGALAADILQRLRRRAQPGAATGELDDAARDAMVERGAEPLFLNYRQGGARPFPAVTCISINEEVVHGIPGDRQLLEGDLVSIDVGLRLNGWCADTATSFVAGGDDAAPDAAALILATRRVLGLAIDMIRPGRLWSEIGDAMEAMCRETEFGIVTEYVGHGIGHALHEAPKAPAYRTGFSGADFELAAGQVIAVEPMLTIPARKPGPSRTAVGEDGLPAWRTRVRLLADGWTVATADGGPACHEEHTIAVTDDGCEVLTARTLEIAAGMG
ncbi:MAG: type I methionyl aminopeptidase [Phycisphaerales bacterium]